MAVNLTTQYLGLTLSNPLIPGASPLCDDLDTAKRLEDVGAPALVLRSLFEEQVSREQSRTVQDWESHSDSFSEAGSFFPAPSEFTLGPHAYLEHLRKVKSAVGIPVIASLNGTSASGWLDYAKQIQQAGADALELNIYFVATDPDESAWAVEQRVISVVDTVRREIQIPLAVKLSPFYSSLSHLAGQLEVVGADGLVLFNRFYQPDIDIEELEFHPQLHLSDSSELLLRLHWLAILSGHHKLGLVASGGIHSTADVVKALMSGANAVQVVSALLKRGPSYLATLRHGLEHWMEEHGYESLDDLVGCMNLMRCPNPAALERGNYMRVLQSWKS